MKYVNNAVDGRRAILEKFPELSAAKFEADGSGWANFAIKVNEKYLFRFPRDEEAYECIKAECEVLKKLKPLLPPNIQVPDYLAEFLDQDYPFVYYEMIQGEPLTLELWQNMQESEQDQLAKNLVQFLEVLHGIDPRECNIETLDPLENYQTRYQEFKAKCFAYLSTEEQNTAEKLFTNYFNNSMMREYHSAVIHHDLSENHILLTRDGIGIIDFGDTIIFDPAMDFAWMYLFDQKLYRKMYNYYQSPKKDMGFEQRIRDFYVPIIPFYGVVYGEETGNNELFQNELADLKANLYALKNKNQL